MQSQHYYSTTRLVLISIFFWWLDDCRRSSNNQERKLTLTVRIFDVITPIKKTRRSNRKGHFRLWIFWNVFRRQIWFEIRSIQNLRDYYCLRFHLQSTQTFCPDSFFWLWYSKSAIILIHSAHPKSISNTNRPVYLRISPRILALNDFSPVEQRLLKQGINVKRGTYAWKY